MNSFISIIFILSILSEFSANSGDSVFSTDSSVTAVSTDTDITAVVTDVATDSSTPDVSIDSLDSTDIMVTQTENIVKRAAIMENNRCGLLEMIIVLDGSGSIGSEDFESAKNFSSNFIEAFSTEKVEIGFVIYSSVVQVIFPLDNNLTLEEMKTLVLNSGYPGQGTETADGMIKAAELFKMVNHTEGAAKVMLVLTDGESNNGVTKGVNAAKALNITTLAIGIGPNTNADELLEIASNHTSHVFPISSYQLLTRSVQILHILTCDLPRVIPEDEEEEYCYELSGDGITFVIQNKTKSERLFNIYAFETLTTGLTNDRKYIPELKNVNRIQEITNRAMVCVTIKGKPDGTNISTDRPDGEDEMKCRCNGWVGNHCGLWSSQVGGFLTGNCIPKGIYFCDNQNSESVLKGKCSLCVPVGEGRDYCGVVVK